MANIADGVDPVGALGAAQLLTRPASEFGNDPMVESLWAMKAVEHMEVYFSLISTVDPKVLKLTPHDDAIYKDFRERFPELDVGHLVESEIKSEESKKEWREFCTKFEDVVEDFNFATLVRLDSEKDYAEENTTLVPRVQFYALEIARNREGCNDSIREKYPAKRRKAE
ncbi:protein PBDC1 [Amblyomma americanum]|uniref:Polysaccharide biosynthesis domain-containing protein n=1 Tax=Amblyomma americanum TaxID=6943 RepID=A0AAQ4EYI5_AMBAM